MARRKARSREDEIKDQERLVTAVVETLTVLVAANPTVPDFLFARKVVLDGRQLLEKEYDDLQRAKTAPARETTA